MCWKEELSDRRWCCRNVEARDWPLHFGTMGGYEASNKQTRHRRIALCVRWSLAISFFIPLVYDLLRYAFTDAYGPDGLCTRVKLDADSRLFFNTSNDDVLQVLNAQGEVVEEVAAVKCVGYWFIYLTHWSYLLEVLYFFFAALATHKAQSELVHPTADARIPCVVRIAWGLFAVMLPASFVVFTMYWGLVYDGSPPSLISVWFHGVNFGAMLLDALQFRVPYYLLHGVYFLLYALAYELWSVVHFTTHVNNGLGDDYIYSVLDWSDPAVTFATSVVVFLLCVAICPLFYFIVRQRRLCQNGKRLVRVETTRAANAVFVDPADFELHDSAFSNPNITELDRIVQ